MTGSGDGEPAAGVTPDGPATARPAAGECVEPMAAPYVPGERGEPAAVRPAEGERVEPVAARPMREEGGDPVCWLSRVCPECGLFLESEPPAACERCGAEVPAG
ncbi:hypothetical protein [Saccharothrix hoggarensis]|uniref:Uncharacterized protein n=1 Tax=Saccharothrix hoggarensis TaxID=913853 RepID=A0ABW3R3J5_9PSEU